MKINIVCIFLVSIVTNSPILFAQNLPPSKGHSIKIIDPNDANTFYIGTKQDGIFRTTNNGETWKRVFAKRKINAFVIYRSTLLVSSLEGVFASSDNGESWQQLLQVAGQSFFTKNERLYLRTMSNGLFQSENGTTWQRAPAQKSFWQKNRSWIIPTAVATIVITALIIESTAPGELAEFPGLPPNTN